MDRRQFFHRLIRYVILATIGTISGAALIKSRHATADNCLPGNACQRCNKAGTCIDKK
jgi:hypothetical protein